MSSTPYYFVRHTWFHQVDVERLVKELGSSFDVVALRRPKHDLSIMEEEKFLVKADTLRVYLSPTKATLFQKERKPFTAKDLKLRERIFSSYFHNRSTPFPWNFMQEPRFEVQSTEKQESTY